MSKNLIIVESPAKAKTIGKFLHNKYNIKASMGHVRDLPKNNFGVNTADDFDAKYIIDPKKRKVITELKKAAKEADEIFLASDHDREGEAIAWHLVQVLKKEISEKPVHRIVFNEITRNAIQKAMQKPGTIDDKKVQSQQARRILDRIVGYNISPLLWKIITKNLSAGRVQSVALRIVCEREEEIIKFIPKEYWNIEAILFRDQLEAFKASLQKFKGKKAKLNDKTSTDEVLQNIKDKQFIISKIKESTRKIHPSPPYITSTLQQDAARLLRFSAKRTMQVAQQLYEGIDLDGDTVGLITYMRTDSLRIANEALKSCRALVKERYGEKKLHSKTRVYKTKSSAQDAHEAIRATNPFHTPESISKFLNKDQMKLYTLIWQKFVATQMIPVTLKSKNLTIEIGDAEFGATGSTIIENGFLDAFPHTRVILGEKIDKGYAEKDVLECKNLDAIQQFTKPPSRFTEAALIKELESLGIGRPSTYATITNTIQVRKYVFLKERKFHPTELGLTVNKFLVSNFSEFFNVKFTAEMEECLDKIEYGEVDKVELLRSYYNSVNDSIKKVDFKDAKKEVSEETDIDCDKCGNKMHLKWGKNGQFLACSNFPECKNIKNFTRNDNGKIEIVEPEKIDEKCPKCGGELMQRSGKYGDFISCSNFPKCKFTKPITLGIKCPDCEDGEITEKKNKKGRYFYSCTNYPKCKFITNSKPVDLSCPSCGNYYLEEKNNKKKGSYKKCPKCGEEVY
ncbi:MAG: type I DNA topoisomerase [Candidatus Cloacimonetes bacterium]|nr:type I DNA topoisomerase [Candidatus Cloacimonadota bacterium]MCF7814641.1 type I DNA topoisomerase [Candidatus Cloacimonadota bacterium]MCF7869108.1 type I DNA topoisomerase [Candidatus Cloacimonadota bacterium]MCF7884529.1 type I DNA topoisomerase [Candidatus Cloacimonadota bacterium]